MDKGGNKYQLPPELIQYLHLRDTTVIAHIANRERNTVFRQKWRSAPEMGIPIQWQQCWETYLTALSEAHVSINNDPDELVWILAEHGKYTPKLGYTHLLSDRKPTHTKEWWQQI